MGWWKDAAIIFVKRFEDAECQVLSWFLSSEMFDMIMRTHNF